MRRIAMLVVVLAAASQALAQAPSREPAAPAEEKGPTVIDAERIDGIGDLEMTARGSAELTQDDMSIFGEVLRYNQELGRLDADGGVRLKMGLDRFFGPRLRYDTFGDTGVFDQPKFLMQGNLPSHGEAREVEFLGKQRYRLKDATFTTCAPGKEDWVVEASQIDLDYETEEGRATFPRLRFFDVPILAAPFGTFPLENRRKSGLLAPSYGNSSLRGIELSVPFYWNIAPEYDATIQPVYMTKRGGMLKNDFRYLDARYEGDLKVEYMPNDTVLQRPRLGISLEHKHTFSSSLIGQIDYNRVSDQRYFVDLSSQVRQSSVGNLLQDGYLTYSGAFGSRTPYTAQVRVQKFQTLQDPLAPITPPYHRVPQINFTTGINDVAGLMDAGLATEFVHFTHPTLVRGSRVSANPVASVPLLRPGWFVTPKAGLRYVSYGLENQAAGNPNSPRAAIPWMSVDSGLLFDREARWFGQSLTQTLEPRLYYVYVPYRNQDQMPVFDTALTDLNFAQLFTENRFGGGDRFGDANQVTAAVTSRFLRSNGQEAFRGTIAQRRYFSDERVALTPGGPLRTYDHSDWLASIGGRLFTHVTFDTTVQYNQREQRPQRYTVAARYAPEAAKVLSASYRYNRATLQQVDFSGQWPLAPGWYAVGRYNYSLLDRRLVEGLAGVEYNAGCWVLRAVFQRMQAATQIASTSFFVQLEFNGVGQLGTTEVVELLNRNVAGYSVSNPRDPLLAPPSGRRPLPFEQVY